MPMSENTLCGPIEAILMVASEPVAASDLADVLGVSVEDVEAQLRGLAAEYLGDGRDCPRTTRGRGRLAHLLRASIR